MTDREHEMCADADKFSQEFLAEENNVGMIKNGRLRGTQEKRMRRYVMRKMTATEKYGWFELRLFAIVTLAKVIYAAWKLWQERNAEAMTGHA